MRLRSGVVCAAALAWWVSRSASRAAPDSPLVVIISASASAHLSIVRIISPPNELAIIYQPKTQLAVPHRVACVQRCRIVRFLFGVLERFCSEPDRVCCLFFGQCARRSAARESPGMKSVVVVGAQWGDEGKGKVVDYLAGSFDYIARVAGGDHARHTVIIC